MKACSEARVQIHYFLISESDGQLHTPAALCPAYASPNNHQIEGRILKCVFGKMCTHINRIHNAQYRAHLGALIAEKTLSDCQLLKTTNLMCTFLRVYACVCS
jgi:hypothetical protein